MTDKYANRHSKTYKNKSNMKIHNFDDFKKNCFGSEKPGFFVLAACYLPFMNRHPCFRCMTLVICITIISILFILWVITTSLINLLVYNLLNAKITAYQMIMIDPTPFFKSIYKKGIFIRLLLQSCHLMFFLSLITTAIRSKVQKGLARDKW